MKKIGAIIIATVLMLSLPCFNVFADHTAELKVSTATVNTDMTAQIDVSINGNVGLCALGFEITYDSAKLQVISAEFSDMFSAASKRVNTKDGSIVFNAAAADNITGDGVVARIVFKVIAADFNGANVGAKLLGEKGFVLHSEADHSLTDITLALSEGAVLPANGTVTDAPVTEAPVTTEPVTEPVTTEPVTTEPVTEPTTEPVTEPVTEATEEPTEAVTTVPASSTPPTDKTELKNAIPIIIFAIVVTFAVALIFASLKKKR